MRTNYDTDILIWATEQAHFIRTAQFNQLDLERIAEEIEDVGKSEVRELEHRLALLLAHLLKWAYQPNRQSSSWARTIKEQRRGVLRRLERTPSLQRLMTDSVWWADIWSDAVALAINETGLDCFPDTCPWAASEILANDWLPMIASKDDGA